jgi:WD40 repeat protein
VLLSGEVAAWPGICPVRACGMGRVSMFIAAVMDEWLKMGRWHCCGTMPALCSCPLRLLTASVHCPLRPLNAPAPSFLPQVVDDGEGFHLEELSCGGYSHKVTLVDFDRSKRYLASAGGTRNTVWDFSGEGPANSTPTVTIGHTKPITAQAWQQDGAGLLATGSKDGRIMVFNVHDYLDGMPNMCLPVAMADAGSDSPVTCIKWAAGGRLYSGHEDGKVCAWQLPEGLELIDVPNEQTAADSHLLESKSPA